MDGLSLDCVMISLSEQFFSLMFEDFAFFQASTKKTLALGCKLTHRYGKQPWFPVPKMIYIHNGPWWIVQIHHHYACIYIYIISTEEYPLVIWDFDPGNSLFEWKPIFYLEVFPILKWLLALVASHSVGLFHIYTIFITNIYIYIICI